MEPNLRLDRDTVLFFKGEFWKDVRRLEVGADAEGDTLQRYSDGVTSIQDELSWLTSLSRSLSKARIPEVLRATDDYIEFRYIKGLRAFNLLVDLKSIHETTGNAKASELALRLLSVLNSHLVEIRECAEKSSMTSDCIPYPYEEKARNTFVLLSSVLCLGPLAEEVLGDIRRLCDLAKAKATAPFRDANPKNVILEIPHLHLERYHSADDRSEMILTMLSNGVLDGLVEEEHLYHVDFSGFRYLCPPCDDCVCLNHHETTCWLNNGTALCHKGRTHVTIMATALLRFVRLGGRKVAYRLLNPSGYNVRHAHDNERYYFERMRDWIETLSRAGVIQGRQWLILNEAMLKACSMEMPFDSIERFEVGPPASGYYSDVFPW